ncbi:ADP-ribosylation family protein [Streptomyces sp. NPDC050703]|uniref:ADP-ribosylation family protein n=1 Tax=Streptomyces sp. NPDC050703 TaxID=3157218 RepID=UPI00341259C1
MHGENTGRPQTATTRDAVAARVLRDWGFELPDALFRFRTFLESLGPVESRALGEMDVSPAGVMDLFADPARVPRAGIDVRVHGRYYRDPPEFLTFLHGGSDGLHHGLWFDDGRTSRGVASYRTHDGGGIDMSAATPLEAVRAILERHWRDLDDDEQSDEVAARRARLGLLRERLTAHGTGERPETGLAYSRAYDGGVHHRDRVTTLDGAGALVTGGTALGRPPQHAVDEYGFATHMYAVFEDPAQFAAALAEARCRLAAGEPAEALVLGRDLHWASGGDPAREAAAADLLPPAYRALGRPALAAIAESHRRHRGLSHVDVLEDEVA